MGEQSVYDNLEPKIHKRVAEAVPDAIPVLDIACGDGRLSSLIASGLATRLMVSISPYLTWPKPGKKRRLEASRILCSSLPGYAETLLS